MNAPRYLGSVYLIECGDFVKIGFSEQIWHRIKTIASITQTKPRLIAVLDVTDPIQPLRLEEETKARFSHLRVTAPWASQQRRKDWFLAAPELLQWASEQVVPKTLKLHFRSIDPGFRTTSGQTPDNPVERLWKSQKR